MMKMDEATALSIVFSNTKKKKRPDDLIKVARAFDYLVKLDKYGSQTALAKRIDLSAEMIRQFLNIFKLPQPIQRLVAERKIDSVDAIKEIAGIKDTDKQVAAAYAFVDSLSKDARDIGRLIKADNILADEAKRVVQNAKPRGMHIFIIDFEEDIYRAIQKRAKLNKIKTADLVKRIVKDWLSNNR
jgi:hypothetical protein